MAGLLERLPAGRGLLLVLDDVHWADEASVEVLAHVLHRPPRAASCSRSRTARGRVAGAWPRRSRPPPAAASSSGSSSGRSPSPRPSRCCREGTEPGRAHRLWAISGGNPFYLEQLARSGAAPTGQAGGPAHDDLVVPGAVIAALSVELDGLPPAALMLLRAGALAGEPFELDLAIAVAEQADAAALDALDVLLARDLVRPTDVPRRLRFRHPILRRAVYESSPLGWRLAAHARAAATLEARGAPATMLARHVEQAASPGDERAVARARRGR